MESTPHDALFRGIFGQPEHAASELACVLPPELLAVIDCATLAPLPATFVDECLTERHADLLFEAKLHGGGSATSCASGSSGGASIPRRGDCRRSSRWSSTTASHPGLRRARSES